MSQVRCLIEESLRRWPGGRSMLGMWEEEQRKLNQRVQEIWVRKRGEIMWCPLGHGKDFSS